MMRNSALLCSIELVFVNGGGGTNKVMIEAVVVVEAGRHIAAAATEV